MGSKVVISLAFAAVIVCLTSAYRAPYQAPSRASTHYQNPTPNNYQAPAHNNYQAPAQKSYVYKYWSAWGNYGACSVTCGWGVQYRYRTCLSKTKYGYGHNSNSYCHGPSSSKKRCYAGRPVDGGWGHWSNWATSHGYQQTRTRQCNYPTPSCGGRYCYGSSTETKNVHLPKVASSYRAPVNNYQAPANNYQAPANNYQAPANNYQAPANNYQAPANNYQAPANNYQAPANNYQAPAKNYRAPANNYRAPANNYRTRASGRYNKPSY